MGIFYKKNNVILTTFKKRRIVVFSILLTLVMGVGFMVVFNIGSMYYIRQQAENAITNSLREYSNVATTQPVKEDQVEVFLTATEIGATDTGFLERSFFSTSIISEYTIKRDASVYTEFEKKIYSYWSKNNAQVKMKTIYSVEIDNHSIYFAGVKVGKQNESERLLHYVDVTSVLYMVKLLNIGFLCILVCAILVASYIGIRTGKKIEDSEQKLRSFFFNASHELKTPLMSIQGYTEGIQSGVIKDIPMATDIILQESKNMAVLVEELLLLSKLESGQLKMQFSAIDVCQLMDEIISMNSPAAKLREITVEFDFSSEIPQVIADEKQLFIAFQNIYGNALKFTKDHIKVKVEHSKKNIIVRIEDNGSGISGEDMPHIFERFYYGEKGSTGIGLSLAHEIIQKHKGTVAAYNEEGATFVVKLPIAK